MLWQFSFRHTVWISMSQLWVTLDQPPRRADVENYISNDQNVVWQHLLRRNQLKAAARVFERHTWSNCNPNSTGKKQYYTSCACLVFNGTFSINRLYRAMEVKSISRRARDNYWYKNIMQLNKERIQQAVRVATPCLRPSFPVGAQACRAPPSRCNVAVFSHRIRSHADRCSRLKAALSKAAWWPWQWCPSHVWRGLSLCQFWSS